VSLIHRIRGKYDEAYRIEHGWGLSPIRNNRELKALIKFCRKELEDIEHMNLNMAKCDAFVKTVELYEVDSPKLYEHINESIGWYWS